MSEETQNDEQDDAAIAAAMSNVLKDVVKAEKQSRDKEQAQKALKLFQEAVGKLSDEGFRILSANTEFQEMAQKVGQRSGTQPGSPIFDGNGRQIGYQPYSYDDFCRIYPMVTWTPPRDDVIEVNGVSCRVIGHIENTAPSIFRDIQMESWRAELAAMAGQNQRRTLETSPYAAADGVTLEVGFYKMTDAELLRQPGNVER